MEEKYRVTVNEEEEFHFTNKEILGTDIQQESPSVFHILKNHASFTVRLEKADFLQKAYTVKVNSNSYDVKIADGLDLLIEDLGLGLVSEQVINEIKAPMPGLILDLLIQPGDHFKKGDYLLVLEAMKMENTLTAPRDGIVKSVTVKKGQTVEKEQLLIEIE